MKYKEYLASEFEKTSQAQTPFEAFLCGFQAHKNFNILKIEEVITGLEESELNFKESIITLTTLLQTILEFGEQEVQDHLEH